MSPGEAPRNYAKNEGNIKKLKCRRKLYRKKEIEFILLASKVPIKNNINIGNVFS